MEKKGEKNPRDAENEQMTGRGLSCTEEATEQSLKFTEDWKVPSFLFSFSAGKTPRKGHFPQFRTRKG